MKVNALKEILEYFYMEKNIYKVLIICLKSGKELKLNWQLGANKYFVAKGVFSYKDSELLTRTFIDVNEIEYITTMSKNNN